MFKSATGVITAWWLFLGAGALILALFTPGEPAEDDPGFNCRTHRNQVCGLPHPSDPDVVILVQFKDGEPVSATVRKLPGQVR
ncbi:hypothetical protein [Lentzea sp. CC55]|uniref:hypothetical protein n=1 Tax=Lentzea sp. CC55 TaxID=2884909 RepID=UPI001F345AAD|nr:hypothetical protein [Lentzea sp. CC55]MCG8926628.1 hypothetical protein [Lentzea sp. CC55]